MSTAKTKTRGNLKTDAAWCIEEIRVQMSTAVKNLQAADECQAIMRGTLRDPASALLSTEGLVRTVKDMLDHTCNLKTAAALIHENTLKLDHAICQLEALEKEAYK